VFPDVFSVADSRPKSMEVRSKRGVGWGLTSGEFRDDRVVLYAMKREPSDLGG